MVKKFIYLSFALLLWPKSLLATTTIEFEEVGSHIPVKWEGNYRDALTYLKEIPLTTSLSRFSIDVSHPLQEEDYTPALRSLLQQHSATLTSLKISGCLFATPGSFEDFQPFFRGLKKIEVLYVDAHYPMIF